MQKGYIPLQSPDIALAQQHQNRQLFQAIGDHETRFAALESTVATLKNSTSSSTTAASTTVFETVSTGGSNSGGITTLGDVNNQRGQAMYVTQSGDNGSLVQFSNNSTVGVTLNASVKTPFFFFPANFGSANVALTPSSGAINGSSSATLQPGNWGIVWYDGKNWEFVTSSFPTIPASYAAVAHQFLNSYNATTGNFTSAQPSYSDISGTPTLATTFAPVANEFINSYNAATGAFTATQPSYSNLSGIPLYSTQTLTAAATITNLIAFVRADATTAAFTVTLPAAPTPGELLVVKKIDPSANVVTIDGNTIPIDGAATTTLTTQYQSIRLIYDSGSNTWNVV